MTKNELIFGFYSGYSEHDKFRTGALISVSAFGNLKFMASSGLRGYQGVGNCNKKSKGGIPPCSLVGIPNYVVNTVPIHMPATRGILGNFYRIFPFNVAVNQYGKKVARGDFGIHADMPPKGTAGCIGIPPGEHWERFQKLMAEIAANGHESINLFVPMP